MAPVAGGVQPDCLCLVAVPAFDRQRAGFYATYGVVYIAASLGWLWMVDGVTPAWTDIIGVGLALASFHWGTDRSEDIIVASQ